MLTKQERQDYKLCGFCGKRHEQSEMIRKYNSPTGWICAQCVLLEHPEYVTDEW